MTTERRRIDRILDPEYLEDVESMDLAELRSRRDLAQTVEKELSYFRRLLQGRLDLLAFEQRRRRGDETRSLIEALPEILTSGVRSGQDLSGRYLSTDLPDMPAKGRRHIDRVLGNDLMMRLGGIDEVELGEATSELADLETEVSGLRKQVQSVVDRLQDEVKDRYKATLAEPAPPV